MAAFEEQPNRVDECWEDLSLTLPTGEMLAARCYGAEDADVCVLALHGFLDNSGSYARLAPALTGAAPSVAAGGAAARGDKGSASTGPEHSMRVVCLDFIGHGRSDHAVSHEYPLVTYVQHVVHVLRALGWARCALVGHSMGGQVAFYAAALLGDAITALVMIDAPLVAMDPSGAPGGLLRAIDERAERMTKTWARHESIDAMADKFVSTLQRSGQRALDREAARAIVERGSVPLAGGKFRFSHDLALKRHSLMYFTAEQRAAFAREIRARVLFVVATGGPYERYIDVLRAVRPVEVLSLEGSHHLHTDLPQVVEIAARVRAFVSQAPPLSSAL